MAYNQLQTHREEISIKIDKNTLIDIISHLNGYIAVMDLSLNIPPLAVKDLKEKLLRLYKSSVNTQQISINRSND